MGFYKINEKIKNARETGFVFNQIVKLATKFESNLSHINICNFLKFPIPILPIQFFKITSQDQEYVNSFCNDDDNDFHYACRQWLLQFSRSK